MAGKQPDNPLLYRIIHIDNLEYAIRHGMYTRNHPKADPNYINIGDNTLINQRQSHPVGVIPPGGFLGDFVPFYFGPLSPMLLNIATGHRGIVKRPQDEIVYVCCRVNSITTNCDSWCFTDGHAKDRLTDFYNSLTDLDNVDWQMVGERYWRNDEADWDKMRRKQAEFLVRDHVPTSCIIGIVVYNDARKQQVEAILNKSGIHLKVVAKRDFYY